MRNSFYYLILVIVRFSYAQQYEIVTDFKATYWCSYQPDSTDSQYVETENFVVLYNAKNHRSLFMPEGKFNKDSLMLNNGDRMEMVKDISRFRSHIPYLVFMDPERRKTTVVGEITGQKVFYETALSEISWVKKDSTRLEKGLVLRLAEADFGGRHWLAWYAPSYPYDMGPYKFRGLPGLIIYLYDTKNHYFFKLEKFEKRSFRYLLDLQNAEKTGPKNFLVRLLRLNLQSNLMMLKKFNINIRVENSNQKTMSADDLIKKAEEKVRRFNNPVELY